MQLKDLANKKICILGLGLENQALLYFLFKQNIKAYFYICDARSQTELGQYHTSLSKQARKKDISIAYRYGSSYNQNLDQYDIIFRIAGYPLHENNLVKAKKAGVQIYSSTKLFFDLCPTSNIIGVTGTKGKGTTATLVYKIMRDAGLTTYLGGNIGIALFSFFDKIKKNDWVVLELSSFQTEDLHKSPHVAILTNFYSEHLAPADPHNPNYHKNLRNYWKAKSNIFKHQNKNDFLIATKELQPKLNKENIKSKVIYFNTTDLVTRLVGKHNKKNIAAAEITAHIIGINKESIKHSVKNFTGLEYRLQLIGEHNKIKYYNDSFATTPESAITALDAFPMNKIILITGGASKKSNFTLLAKKIKQKVKVIILLPGQGSQEIKQQLKQLKYHPIIEASSMVEAMGYAQAQALQGDIILLSPACASFGIFKNYKDRGQQFNNISKELINRKN